MRDALLDTHAMLWSVGDYARLSDAVAVTLRSTTNVVYVSIVSLWEVAIKEGRGSLNLTPAVQRLFEEGGFYECGFVLLDINLAHLNELRSLPPASATHGDPFDRMIAAQARAEGLELLSADAKMDACGVKRVW